MRTLYFIVHCFTMNSLEIDFMKDQMTNTVDSIIRYCMAKTSLKAVVE